MLREKMIAGGQKYIDIIYDDPFIQGIIAGNLDFEAVCHYLKADHIYLKQFADIYALCLAKAKSREEKQFFLGQIDFLINKELEGIEGPHQCLARYTGIPYSEIIQDGEWYPSADHYIKHMFYAIHEQGIAGALSAMAPCPWLYHEIAKKIKANHQIGDQHPFRNWIDFYEDRSSDGIMDFFFDLIEKYSLAMDNLEKAALIDNFMKSCQHERRFFQMAVDQEKWED